MTDQFCAARGCIRPTSGHVLCHDDRDLLTRTLRDLPFLLVSLHEAATRQTVYSRVGGLLVEDDDLGAPVPFNPKAANLQRRAVATIRTWQQRAADRVGIPVRHPIPVKAVTWLHDNVTAGRLNTWVDLGKMLDDLAALSGKITAAIDRPDTSWYAGQCSDQSLTDAGDTITCTNELYVAEGARFVECSRCHAVFDVELRRGILLDEADRALATATEITRALVVLTDYDRGEAKLVARISQWNKRGRLEQRGTAIEHGVTRPTYRVGDVRALLLLDEQRELLAVQKRTADKARRAAKKAAKAEHEHAAT